MPKYTVTVSDVIHMRRAVQLPITAKDEDTAAEKALAYVSAHAGEIAWDEEQIDADPYEVEDILEA